MSTRIFLIDDDTDSRESLAAALVDAGYRVDQAANGREALDALHSREVPGIILLDLLMPVMNGWEFCATKKTDPTLAPIPVIAMSGAARTDPRSPYYIDVDDVVAKPIDWDDLLRKVEKHVRDRQERSLG